MSRAGRWIVLVAAVLAAAVMATEIAAGASLFTALAKSAAAAVGVMALAGIALRLLEGAAVSGVQLPGGAGVQPDGGNKTDELARDLRRLSLMTEVRLRRLERKVLEQNGRGGSIN